MYKKKASTVLNLVAYQDEDKSLETDNVAMQIKSEIKNLSGIKDKYLVLDENSLTETILPTLRDMLVAIFPKFKDNFKSVALINSFVTTIASFQGVYASSCFGIVCQRKENYWVSARILSDSSYDELRQFKISTFHHASEDKRSMLDSKRGLIQGVTDSFDAHLSTQNGLKQTHPLTSVVFQHSKSPRKDAREPIPRLKKGI